VVTPEGIAAVEAIVKKNRRVTVNEIAKHLDMSHGSAYHVIHDVMQMKNYLILKFSFDSPS
jgi:predicted transcriptional regulator